MILNHIENLIVLKKNGWSIETIQKYHCKRIKRLYLAQFFVFAMDMRTIDAIVQNADALAD